jgi:DNA processing protein
VTCLEDILDELGDAGAALKSGITQADDAAGPPTIAALTEDETEVLKALGPEPMPMETLCETTTLPPARVAGALTGLQLKSAVRRVEGELFERSR